MSSKDNVKYFFRAIFLLGSIPMIVASIYVFVLRVQLLYSGAKAEGIVSRKFIVERKVDHTSSSDTYESYELDYSFRVNEKEYRKSGDSVSRTQWEDLSVGDTLIILYDKSNPEKFTLESDTEIEGFFECILIFVIGMAGFIYSFHFEPTVNQND